jgi:hypothetical protein
MLTRQQIGDLYHIAIYNEMRDVLLPHLDPACLHTQQRQAWVHAMTPNNFRPSGDWNVLDRVMYHVARSARMLVNPDYTSIDGHGLHTVMRESRRVHEQIDLQVQVFKRSILEARIDPKPFMMHALHRRVHDAILAGGRLDMRNWHGDDDNPCGTTHCRAGWAVHLHPERDALKATCNTPLLAMLIYVTSTNTLPDFHGCNDTVMADIARCAMAV